LKSNAEKSVVGEDSMKWLMVFAALVISAQEVAKAEEIPTRSWTDRMKGLGAFDARASGNIPSVINDAGFL
jgi:hypothetical protein